MDSIEILNKLIPQFAKKQFKGVYLWKYLEYELTLGIKNNYQNIDRNVAILGGLSDFVPEGTEEDAKKTQEMINSLEQKDILFGMIPLRRLYHGKLEHTALDAYINTIDLEKYYVLETDMGGQSDEDVITKNRKRYKSLGVLKLYGKKDTSKEEIAEFLIKEYVHPMEVAFNRVFAKQELLRCVFKASSVLQIRDAHVNFFEEVLDRVKPKIICYTHGADPNLCFLNEAARNKGIPTAEIEHGAIVKNIMYPINLNYSDYYLSQSDILTKPMLDKGFENIITVGKPGVYEHIEWEDKGDKPIVVSIISSLEPGMFELSIELAKELEMQKYIVVYKAHSSEMWENSELQGIQKENLNWQFMDGTVDVRDLYCISDIVIGVRSSAILDALPFNKIKVIAKKDEQEEEGITGQFTFLNELKLLGDLIICDTNEEIYSEVITFQRNTEYRGKVNHYWPVDAEQKFTQFIYSFL